MIRSVTVYRRGARVVRAVPMDPAATRVRIDGLPLALDDASVRIAVEGAGARAVAVRLGLDAPPEDPSLAPARDEEVRSAEHEVARANAEVSRIEGALARMEA